MPDGLPKKSKKRVFSGNHQRSWLWGRHAVCETLHAGKWPVVEIYVSGEALHQCSELLEVKRSEGISVEVVAPSRLEQLTHSTEHQGIIARLGEFPYYALEDFFQDLRLAMNEHRSGTHDSGDRSPDNASSSPPLIVVCDRIQDAFNFGAILRGCDGANAFGVIVGDRSQAAVTPHVVRSSSGAVNYLRIARAIDLASAITAIKVLGIEAVAADSNAKESVWETSLVGPKAVVIGSESYGVSPEILALCDQKLVIPMMGRVTSLNAAVATGILLYEVRRQQMTKR